MIEEMALQNYERLGTAGIFIAYLIFDRVYFLRKLIKSMEKQELAFIKLIDRMEYH